MPWTNSREAGVGRGDGAVTLGLLVFPLAFFRVTEVFPPFGFFSGVTFFEATFLAALGLPMAFFGLAERGAAVLDRVFAFFAVCVGVAII
ncbi:MAG: hypothetical protein OSA08_09110 [Arenicellales bacterium]|nr:hypothetical protein [Arenicellales bacterium]